MGKSSKNSSQDSRKQMQKPDNFAKKIILVCSSSSLKSQTSKNSNKSTKGRRQASKSEKISHIQRGKQISRAFCNYFQALAKSLFFIYYFLCDQSNEGNIHNPLNAMTIHSQQVQDFVENPRLFLSIFDIFCRMTFPSLKKSLDTDFKQQYMDQEPSKTFSFALRELRKDCRLSGRQQILWLNEAKVKCIYILSILLIGIDLRKIDRLIIKQNSEKSIKTQFDRIIKLLLSQTKLLNRGVFNYITEGWDSVMQIYFNGSIQPLLEEVEQVELRQQHPLLAVQNSHSQEIIETQPLRIGQNRRQEQVLHGSIFPQNHPFEVQITHQNEFRHRHTQQEKYFERRRNNDILDEEQFSLIEDSNFRNGFELMDLEQPYQSSVISQHRTQYRNRMTEGDEQIGQQRRTVIPNQNPQNRYKKRAKSIFNYQKVKTKEQNDKKKILKKKQSKKEPQVQEQMMEQQIQPPSQFYLDQCLNINQTSGNSQKLQSRNSMIIESARKLTKSTCLPGTRKGKDHKQRQIDMLIQLLLQDEFVIAHAMANHIIHALQDNKCFIQGKQVPEKKEQQKKPSKKGKKK